MMPGNCRKCAGTGTITVQPETCNRTCPICGGSGLDPVYGRPLGLRCENCKGYGKLRDWPYATTCPKCNGSGKHTPAKQAVS
jgi:DnaJ-class molecular chaperone